VRGHARVPLNCIVKQRASLCAVHACGYLDMIASFALHGHATCCRQTLVGGNYSVLNTATLQPQPDHYSPLLWSRIMSFLVLHAFPDASNPELRAYAHRTQPSAGFPSAAVLF
jgi:hypothetical protein